MSWANLVVETCTDKVEWFCKMRDFLCKRNGTYDYSATGIGWTLHDSSYATDEDNPAINDWYVVYSPGESGNDDLYMKIVYVSGYIKVQGYLYWNNTTHTGVQNYNASNIMNLAETGSCELAIYGDLDFCYFLDVENHATYDYMGFFGKLDAGIYDTTVATSTASLSSGSDVTITLDAVPSAWEVGDNIVIHDNARIDFIEIKTIPNGTSITADLSYSYTADVKLAGSFPYCVNSSTTSMSCAALHGHVTTTAVSINEIITPLASVDPDGLNDVYPVVKVHYTTTDTYMGSLPNFWRCPSYTGLTEKAVYNSFDGTISARHYKYYSSHYCMIKEV